MLQLNSLDISSNETRHKFMASRQLYFTYNRLNAQVLINVKQMFCVRPFIKFDKIEIKTIKKYPSQNSQPH